MKDILVSLLVMEGFPEEKAYWLVEDIFKQIAEPDNGLTKEKQEALAATGKMDRGAFAEVISR